MASIRTGFVMLGGKKIFISVRDSHNGSWVTTSTSQHPKAPHLTDVESALKKVPHAQTKLTNGKAVPV